MRRHRFPPRPVSRSLSLAVLAVVTFVLAPGVGFAQEPGEIRVHVLPIENRTDRAQFDAVGATVSDTVALTLRLLGTYRISQGQQPAIAAVLPLPTDPSQRLDTLGMIAETLEVENVVFGEVLPEAVGGTGSAATTSQASSGELPRIRLAVFDRLSGSITFAAERTPTSLFDIFTVTDELAAEVLSGFSGRRVTFGSIRITPEVSLEVPSSDAAGDTPIVAGETPPSVEATTSVPSYRVVLDGELL